MKTAAPALVANGRPHLMSLVGTYSLEGPTGSDAELPVTQRRHDRTASCLQVGEQDRYNAEVKTCAATSPAVFVEEIVRE